MSKRPARSYHLLPAATSQDDSQAELGLCGPDSPEVHPPQTSAIALHSLRGCSSTAFAAKDPACEVDANIIRAAQPVFEVAADSRSSRKGSAGQLLFRRPVAALGLVPRPLVLFSAGAIAGAIGKTITAPLDRVKLLLQTGGGLQTGSLHQAAQKGVIPALISIGKEEGLRGYWKGNIPQILKVVPYSALQLYSYDIIKRRMAGDRKQLFVTDRMVAGACAGMLATLVTYPLDTMRLRLAVDPSVRSVSGTMRALVREGSYGAFFRGLNTSLLSIAPYVALELSLFDTLPQQVPPFARGFTAAFIATSACYPLDTIRRQIQLQSAGRVPLRYVLHTINQRGGWQAFYRGFLPNAVKNLPNKGIRLTVFDSAKRLITASETALAEEQAAGTI